MSEGVVYIGRKPVMNYCLAVMTAIENNDRVELKARGGAISTAVDVAEVTRNRFIKDLTVDKIEIGSESLESFDGGIKNVSSISILLKK